MCFVHVTAHPEIYTYCHTLSRHEALPISCRHPRPGDGWGARDDPRRTGGGDLPRRDEARKRPPSDPVSAMIPGEIITGDDEHVLNDGLPVTTIAVANRGDRPIQVGSHYHLAETTAALMVDRKAAYGQRLHIPSGTAVQLGRAPG